MLSDIYNNHILIEKLFTIKSSDIKDLGDSNLGFAIAHEQQYTAINPKITILFTSIFLQCNSEIHKNVILNDILC